MESSTSTLVLRSGAALVFDSNSLQSQQNLPTQFIWPTKDQALTQDHLNEPVIDLQGFRNGEKQATAEAAELIRIACSNHGFFQVTNHGVDSNLISLAYEEIDGVFKLPLEKKLSLRRKPGSVSGYSGAHADRYSSNLPWKETFSFGFHGKETENIVVDYFNSILGLDFSNTGKVYQKYCEAMKELSLVIFELLAISLGVDRSHYKEFFEDASSIMRMNYYPPCNRNSGILGTGPHCDPTSLTILHQDGVGGLQVFLDNKWREVMPRQDALVINIGDTFMALCNGKYKSCLHRAVVNSKRERKSLVYFVSPKEDKVVRPPEDLVCSQVPRNYPDFTWSHLLDFTQLHYRADFHTLPSFFRWLNNNNNNNNNNNTTSHSPANTSNNIS